MHTIPLTQSYGAQYALLLSWCDKLLVCPSTLNLVLSLANVHSWPTRLHAIAFVAFSMFITPYEVLTSVIAKLGSGAGFSYRLD